MKNTKKRIPQFKDEDQEREFWATHSPLDYFDSSRPLKGNFPNLKPSLKSVSIRLPEDMLIELKGLANKRDVPYQSLLKIFLAKQIALEQEYTAGRPERRKRKRKTAASDALRR